MEIFLVVVSNYDYNAIHSAWVTREEAETRIEEARTTPESDPALVVQAGNFSVKVVKVGEILGEHERLLWA